MFTSLNTHSIFSKMRGTASLRELLAQAVKYRMSHLALTEVNGIWGFIRFVQFSREFNIQSIAVSSKIRNLPIDNINLLRFNTR